MRDGELEKSFGFHEKKVSVSIKVSNGSVFRVGVCCSLQKCISGNTFPQRAVIRVCIDVIPIKQIIIINLPCSLNLVDSFTSMV